VQVWYDFQKAVAYSMLEWPDEGVPGLRRSPWVLYGNSPLHQTAGPRGQGGSRVDHEFQEISSIIEYIQEIHGEDDERHFLHGAQALLEAEPREVKRKWQAPAHLSFISILFILLIILLLGDALVSRFGVKVD
jgi:hypothetical protein